MTISQVAWLGVTKPIPANKMLLRIIDATVYYRLIVPIVLLEYKQYVFIFDILCRLLDNKI